MTTDTKLKIAAGASTVGAGVLGGLTAGPLGAIVGGLGALTVFLTGLYHTTPAASPAPPKDSAKA